MLWIELLLSAVGDMGPGDVGGDESREVEDAPAFGGEAWMLGERGRNMLSLSLSSYLNVGDQPSLKVSQMEDIIMISRNRSSVSHMSAPPASSAIASAKCVEPCFGVLRGVTAEGSGILKESFMESEVFVNVAMTGCRRVLGEIVLKLKLLSATGLLPSLQRFGTHLTVTPRPCSSVENSS